MALHDISKSLDRDRPSPSGHDVVIGGAQPAHGTHSVNYITDATTSTTIPDAHNGKFLIAKAGTFTYDQQINTNDPGGAGQFIPTEILLGVVNHGLGYVPGIKAYYNGVNGWWPLPYVDHATFFTTVVWYSFTVQVDVANIYFYFRAMSYKGLSGLGGAEFKYYLLRQSSS